MDLPGYGYAKAGREQRLVWQSRVEHYLSERTSLGALVLIMDIRHPLRELDEQLIHWCQGSEMPLLVLLNKADKLSRSAANLALANVSKQLQPGAPCMQTLVFSALKGTGCAAAVHQLRQWLQLV